ncbi:MAG: LLM class flavin-dependent oxidoreductase [Acidimicrobiales bacterium]
MNERAAWGAMLRRDVPPALEVQHAAVLDGLFDELWVVEDLGWAGGIAQLAAVLAATTRAHVGHGIAPAPFRSPAALAMEWAALAEMHPGRLRGAIGHGVPHWMGQIGRSVGSPLTLLRETVDSVQRLLAGNRLSVEGRYVKLDDVGLVFPPSDVPSVSIGALGPKSLRLSGSVAAGTVLPEGQGPDEIGRARSLIEEGRIDAGRSDPHRLTVFVGYHVGGSTGLAPRNPDAPVGFEIVTESFDEAAEQLLDVEDAGADSVVLVPMGVDPLEDLGGAAENVLPLLRRGR